MYLEQPAAPDLLRVGDEDELVLEVQSSLPKVP